MKVLKIDRTEKKVFLVIFFLRKKKYFFNCVLQSERYGRTKKEKVVKCKF